MFIYLVYGKEYLVLMAKFNFFKKNKDKKKNKKKVKNLAGKIVVFAMLILMIASTIISLLAI
jgi:hypothetical protein